jgi:SAM-dependent methyltransferase
MNNVVYRTDAISRYFASNRVTWPQFYPSERAVISQLGLGRGQTVLDIGCGCGGLGLALRDEFGVEQYTGVEINPQAAALAAEMNGQATIYGGDILALSDGALRGRVFDVVFSLSCVDWNVEFSDMLAAAWRHVRPGGYFVATFRLTTGTGCTDMTRSYQFINYEGEREGERASYVVLNAGDLGERLRAFEISEIIANGYWGRPSATAVTPYEQLCFAAFALRRRAAGETASAPRYRLDVPDEIRELLQSPRR